MRQTGIAGEVVRERVTLPIWRFRALSIQGLLLVSAAFLLPAAAHLAGLPVRILLPMHWPVILVGLCYGWRSGLLVGLASPGLSFVISGMPLPAILPAMTLELAAYGFLAGFLRESLRLGKSLSTAASLIGGRVLFIAFVAATAAVKAPILEYLKLALLPGLPAVLGQFLFLPLAAGWWVRREQGK